METQTPPRRFLILEIDPQARAQMERWIFDILKGEGGGEVLFSDSVRAALDVLDGTLMGEKGINVLISSWDLPGYATGLGLLKLVRRQEQFRSIAVVLVSTPSPEASEQEKSQVARAAHADVYLSKPLHEESFKLAIRDVLARN